jgi:integrase
MPKKRSNGDGALYFDKKRKLWKGVIDDGFWPDGRRRQRTVTSRSQATARQKLVDLKREIQDFGAPLDKQTTLEDWSWRWIREQCQPRMKPNGLKSYESMVRVWIVPTLGRKKVAALKPSDVRTLMQAVLAGGRSSSTARKVYNVLFGILDAARREGLTARNVVADVTPPAMAISSRTALSTEEAHAVLRAAAEEIDGTRWWAAILQGFRQSERLGAQLADLDLDAGIYRVAWTLGQVNSEHACGTPVNGEWPCGKVRGASCSNPRLKVPLGFRYRQLVGRLCLVPPKSGKVRDVPLAPPLVAALRRYLEATRDIPNPYGLIWRHDDGSPILPQEDEQDWRDLLHRAGLITAEQTKPPRDREPGTPDVPGAHSARHTTATVLMELGVPNKIIGEIVGHQSEKVTLGYQHVSTPAARDAMERVGEHFAEALER